jgi:hypothetical protein
MNRVNMKQTSSSKETSNYAANQKLNNLRNDRDSLIEFQSKGTLTPVGKRNLTRIEKKIAEIEAEFNA